MQKGHIRSHHPGFTSPELLRAPVLPTMFPCAEGVKMPQIGSEEKAVKPSIVLSLDKPVLVAPRLPTQVSDSYVKTISSDLTFAEDVVKHRSFHTLPYDPKYLREALDISDVVGPREKTHYTLARHNTRGPDTRHVPCHLQARTGHRLKPIPRKILDKANTMHKQELAFRAQQAEVLAKDKASSDGSPRDAFFYTEVGEAGTATEEIKPIFKNQWDEYLLSIVSGGTAHWIANHQTDPHYNQDRLRKFLKDRSGGSLDQRAELIRDTASEPDDELETQQAQLSRSKWRRPDETLLDRVRRTMAADDDKGTDPYADDTNAAFYRMPAGFRRAKKQQDKEEDAACNLTAYNIDVPRYLPPPLPTIRDSFNPRLRTRVYDTDNEYQKDWLTGGRHVHDRTLPHDRIVTDTGNKYRKQLQHELPRKPSTWFPLSAREESEQERRAHGVNHVQKGLHRWAQLPEPVDDITGKILPPSADDPFALQTSKVADGQMRAPALDGFDPAGDSAAPKFMRTKNTLTMMVNDWRSRWHLDMRYADATPEDLIRDMADLHPHIRLKAISTCARAAEYTPPPEPGIQLSSEPAVDYVKQLPENLFVALACCLDDLDDKVRLAAAIALYTLERPNDKACTILRSTLHQEGGSDDKWTAAQCLAYFGDCDSHVVGELIKQLLEADDLMRHEQAATLLSTLSEGSTLVHCMLAEQMNSSSWRHRVMAIKTIPKLQGHINKDLVHKLSTLMWFDWHTEVRKAAAQALGKTGHGKDVHDDLIAKIKGANEKTRVEAVSKVGHLGIMTAKLLPIFLDCFHDNYVSVRMEACIACTNLRMRDQQVLDKLVFAATFDPIWKIKALAIQAMGLIGETPANVRECILWAFRFEEQEGVRAEACHAIRQLQMKDAEVAQILQDRYLVESSHIVQDELLKALEMFGISPTEDMNMVAQIKGEVRKLCTKTNISAQICVNEKEDRDRENVARMIARPPTPKKEEVHRPYSQLSQASASGFSHTSRLPLVDMRPYSRESSVVDREIQEIFEKARKGTLTPESMSRPTTSSKSRPSSSKSRPTTAQSAKSRVTEPPIDEDEELADVDSVQEESGENGRDSQPMDAETEQPQEQQSQEEGGEGQGQAEQVKVKDNPVFTDQQVYVELTGKGVEGDSSGEVIKLTHTTPAQLDNAEPNKPESAQEEEAETGEPKPGADDEQSGVPVEESEATTDADSFSLGDSNLELNEIPEKDSVQVAEQQPTVPIPEESAVALET